MRFAHLFLLIQRHEVLPRQVLDDGHIEILFLEELFELVHVLAVDQAKYLTFFHYEPLRAGLVLVFFVDDLRCKLSFRAHLPNVEDLICLMHTFEKLPLPICSIT